MYDAMTQLISHLGEDVISIKTHRELRVCAVMFEMPHVRPTGTARLTVTFDLSLASLQQYYDKVSKRARLHMYMDHRPDYAV